MRAACVLILIATLLSCPVHCMGLTLSGSAQVEPRSGCSCCQRQAPVRDADSGQNDREPVAPDDDCQCASCLCHGAIHNDDGTLHRLMESTRESADLTATVVAPAVTGLDRDFGERPPNASAAGRSLRHALHSMQV